MGRVLLDIAIILVVAKLASELSDRIGIPAVIGEIAAGILIGPSVLSLVGVSDTLHVLAELGVKIGRAHV
jgi:Kef-type K+ transport system membrane component KefB